MYRNNSSLRACAESSPGSYHAVFDKLVDWCENLSYVAHVLINYDLPKLNAWLLNQIRKGYADLRVTPKGGKPTPKIVFRKGSQGNRIQHYENHRVYVEKLIRDLMAEEIARIKGNSS